MVKVTPHDNLVPSTRDLWVRDHPFSDLVYNHMLARKLIRAASQFFHLRKDAVIFSGYVWDQNEGFFVINLWHEGSLVRSLTLANLGYSGALHAETVGGQFQEVVGWDLIGTIAHRPEACMVAAAT